MAWSVLQSTSGVITVTGATVAATFTTANCTAGTKLVAALTMSISTTVSVTSVRDAASNSMTQIGFLDSTANGVAVALYAMDTPAADVGIKPTITATVAGNSDMSLVVLEVSGLATGNTLAAMIDGGALAASNTGVAAATMASGAYTSTAVSEFLIAVFSDNGGPETMAAPWGTLSPSSVNNSSFANCLVAYKNSSSAAEGGASTTWAYSSGTQTGWANLLTAFKVTAGGAAPNGQVPPGAPMVSQRPAKRRSRAFLGDTGITANGQPGGTNAAAIPGPPGTVPPSAPMVYRRSARQLNAIAGLDRGPAAAGGQPGGTNAAPGGTPPATRVMLARTSRLVETYRQVT